MQDITRNMSKLDKAPLMIQRADSPRDEVTQSHLMNLTEIERSATASISSRMFSSVSPKQAKI